MAWTVHPHEVMFVRDCMCRHLLTVSPDTSVHKARLLMREARVHALPVTAAGRPVGWITEEDIRRRLPLSRNTLADREVEELLLHLSVGGLMGLHLVTVGPGTPLLDAAQLMRHEQVRLLAVVDRDGLVGLLSDGDVLDGLIAMLSGGRDGEGQIGIKKVG